MTYLHNVMAAIGNEWNYETVLLPNSYVKNSVFMKDSRDLNMKIIAHTSANKRLDTKIALAVGGLLTSDFHVLE